MNFHDINLKYTYETEKNDLLNEFYIPVLTCAKRYDRISGFFSSTSLAISARGIAGLISNGGTMRLITCPKLSREDAEKINLLVENPDEIVSENLIKELDSIEDKFMEDHVEALGWMLSNGYLQMKIALVCDKGKYISEEKAYSHSIMHQKVGIMYDEEFNGISFSGSNNESATGWLDNIEEFKVFKGWEEGQKIYFNDDHKKFEEFWNDKRVGVKVIDLPTAVKNKFIEKSEKYSFEKIALHQYYANKHISHLKKEKQNLELFFYQKEAVEKWENNNYQLLLEMATGTGKTRTAIGCIQKILVKESSKVLVVIACPQTTLSIQWKNDIEKLKTNVDQSIICDGTTSNWRQNFEKEIKKLSLGYYKNLVVYTTHQTCSNEDFISIVNNYGNKINCFFVGDEVHGMGAHKTKNGLLEAYKYRLGLSATPERWFDDFGSGVIRSFFGNDSYKFTIKDALKTINPITGKTFLVNYRYHPHFIKLTEKELLDYKNLSDKITKMSQIKKDDNDDVLQYLLFKRANLEKNAENKYKELEKILDEQKEKISDTIIFVSDEQLNGVMKILGDRGIIAHRFTQKESATPSPKFGGISEREYLIQKFINKEYQVLVAIKCLDEGIDIPSAKRAIVMASSTNPREYVQRIGRVIRQDKGKQQADIFDLIIKPDLSGYKEDDLSKLEKKIFEKEMVRVKELSENALNNSEAINIMYEVLGGMV